jgi:hypothetical protein
MEKQLGQKYISYYYAISDFILSEDIDLNLVTKIIEGMPSVDVAIAKLLSTGSENEIIIDNQFKTDIDEILDILRSKSTNNDFHLLIDDLKNDINYFSNKTKATILNEIY